MLGVTVRKVEKRCKRYVKGEKPRPPFGASDTISATNILASGGRGSVGRRELSGIGVTSAGRSAATTATYVGRVAISRDWAANVSRRCVGHSGR